MIGHFYTCYRKQENKEIVMLKRFTQKPYHSFDYCDALFLRNLRKNEDYERYPEYLIHDSYGTVIRQVNTNLSD